MLGRGGQGAIYTECILCQPTPRLTTLKQPPGAQILVVSHKLNKLFTEKIKNTKIKVNAGIFDI